MRVIMDALKLYGLVLHNLTSLNSYSSQDTTAIKLWGQVRLLSQTKWLENLDRMECNKESIGRTSSAKSATKAKLLAYYKMAPPK